MQMPVDFDWNHVAYWEHYKGGRYVLVEPEHYVAHLEEDADKDIPDGMKKVVLYRSLDVNPEKVWARRWDVFFFDKVEWNGETVQRFKAVTWREAFLKELKKEGKTVV